jgi:competence protein ComEA
MSKFLQTLSPSSMSSPRRSRRAHLHAVTLRLVLAALVLSTLAPLAAQAAEGAEADAPAKSAAGVVNINTADAEQLALLPRVGPAVSQRILEFREANGKFKDPADLILVRGIGEKTFALLKPHVTVSGETTLHEKVRLSRSAGDGQ